MKTVFNLKQYVVLVVAVFAMTSCLKSEEEKFQVYGGGYYIQNVRVVSENEFSSTFIPFLAVSSASYSHVIVSCSVKAQTGESIYMTKMDDSGIMWNSNLMLPTEFSSLPSGSFTVVATNQDQESFQTTISLNITRSMEDKLESTLEYNTSTKVVKATFKEVKNADSYRIMVDKDEYSFNKLHIKAYTKTQLEQSKWEVEFTLSDSDFNYIATGTNRIYTAATIDAQSTSGSGTPHVYQIGAIKSLIKE